MKSLARRLFDAVRGVFTRSSGAEQDDIQLPGMERADMESAYRILEG